jgi:subtilase family serine protease
MNASVSGSDRGLPFILPPDVRRVCGSRKADEPHCEALARTDGASNNGYVPSDLQSAYNLPSTTKGAGQTVAVIELLDDPNVESDLFQYRNTFKLPVCSTLNGCFRRVNQRGKTNKYPPPDANNAIETSLDIDMVSAACPNCNILLVEGDSNTWKSLAQSVDEAVKLGATIVSVSYGGTKKDINPADYDHPGVVILAAGGDHGYYGHGNQVPADLPTVVAVGGTSLTRTGSGRGWSETVYGGTGSGCSQYVKPSWQTDAGCKTRTANDIAAVADPATGVAVYDSYQEVGWMQIGGTSVSTPINASVFALAGNASSMNAAQSFYQAANQAYLFDVTTGFNGGCPHKYTYLCNGVVGYDGPTGWGTPNGAGAY